MGITVTGGVKIPQGKFTVTSNRPPTWTTAAGTIGTEDELIVVSFQFEASDPEQGTSNLTFTKISGDFPAGLSMDSAGLLTGTASDVVSDTTSNFTLRVTDSGGLFEDRAFSMTINNVVPEVPETVNGLVLWFDADDASTITESSNLVTNWADKGGTANDAIASGSQRPLLVSSLQNGKPGIDFPSDAERLRITKQSDINNFWSGGGYIIGVVHLNSNSEFLFEKKTSSLGWRMNALASGGFSALSMRQDWTTTDGSWRTDFSIPHDTTILFEFQFNQNSASNVPIIKINGSSKPITEGPNSAGSAISDTNENLGFGGRFSANQGWKAPIFEVIWYNQIPSSGDQTSLRTYLNDKWAIF